MKEKSSSPTQKSHQRFFKHPIINYGVKAENVHRIARKYFNEINSLTKKEIYQYIEGLFKSGYQEEAQIAALWSYKLKEQYQKEDIHIFKKWIDRYIDDWAKCDSFCNHSVGALIDMYPELITELKEWSKSANIWLKRASAVSLIIPAKKGKFLKDIFEIADTLLLDEHHMVQKGYGWMLKVASQKHQKKVYEYVLSKRAIMPRTSLRYAIEKMPKEMKKEAMKKIP